MTQDTLKDFEHIPLEKFEFVNQGERISDQKFEDKPIGYFKDAWIRFRKNKGSIVASIIIIVIVLYALLAPVFTTNFNQTFLDVFYAKKPPRNLLLKKIGIADGGTGRQFSEHIRTWTQPVLHQHCSSVCKRKGNI